MVKREKYKERAFTQTKTSKAFKTGTEHRALTKDSLAAAQWANLFAKGKLNGQAGKEQKAKKRTQFVRDPQVCPRCYTHQKRNGYTRCSLCLSTVPRYSLTNNADSGRQTTWDDFVERPGNTCAAAADISSQQTLTQMARR